jgi:hypothetical protein
LCIIVFLAVTVKENRSATMAAEGHSLVHDRGFVVRITAVGTVKYL